MCAAHLEGDAAAGRVELAGHHPAPDAHLHVPAVTDADTPAVTAAQPPQRPCWLRPVPASRTRVEDVRGVGGVGAGLGEEASHQAGGGRRRECWLRCLVKREGERERRRKERERERERDI